MKLIPSADGTKIDLEINGTIVATFMNNGKLLMNEVELPGGLLMSAFGQKSHATYGYQKLPGGTIIQWGRTTDLSDTSPGSVSITFPIAFPNAVLNVSAMEAASTGNKSVFSVANYTLADMSVAYYRVYGSATGAIFWFALGY